MSKDIQKTVRQSVKSVWWEMWFERLVEVLSQSHQTCFIDALKQY